MALDIEYVEVDPMARPFKRATLLGRGNGVNLTVSTPLADHGGPSGYYGGKGESVYLTTDSGKHNVWPALDDLEAFANLILQEVARQRKESK